MWCAFHGVIAVQLINCENLSSIPPLLHTHYEADGMLGTSTTDTVEDGVECVNPALVRRFQRG